MECSPRLSALRGHWHQSPAVGEVGGTQVPRVQGREKTHRGRGQTQCALSKARLACHRCSCVTKFRVINQNVELSGVSLCEVRIPSLGCEHDAWNSTATFNHELGALMVENKVDTAWFFDHNGFLKISFLDLFLNFCKLKKVKNKISSYKLESKNKNKEM